MVDFSTNGTALTTKMHSELKSRGYRYFLIKDVLLCQATGRILSLTLCPVRGMSRGFTDSCTGIDDQMILCLLEKKVEIKLSALTFV